MPSINLSSIQRKAEKCLEQPSYQKKKKQIVDNYMMGKASIYIRGGGVLPASLAASKFIDVLKNEVSSHGFVGGSLGSTAVSALQQLKHGDVYSIGGGIYTVDVWFYGDLSRDSLAPGKFDGIDNIAALLNSGYKAGHTVYGIWKGHGDERRASLVERDGVHFIEQAIRDFMSNYASEYGVFKIEVDDIYK